MIEIERIIEMLQEFNFDKNTKEDRKFFIDFICECLKKHTPEAKKDIVKVTCYGKTKEYEREEAIKHFLKCMCACEGSEKERYTNIYLGLIQGYKEVTDDIE